MKQPGPASRYRMHVSNMFTENFLCSLKANTERLKSISCNRNKPNAYVKHIANYSGVNLGEATCRSITASRPMISKT